MSPHRPAVALCLLLASCVPAGDPYPGEQPPPDPTCESCCPEDAWTIEVIASEGDVGKYASLAIGPDDSLHVAYHNGSAGALDVASRPPGGAWSIDTVSGFGLAGRHADLAVDGAGTLHVVFEGQQGTLEYARRPTAGSWTLDPLSGPITSAAIAVEENGTAHVLYADLFMYYVTLKGPSEMLSAMGADPAMVLTGNTLDAVFTSPSGEAVHASRWLSGTGWSLESLASFDIVGLELPGSAIAVGAAETLHVLFRDPGNDMLRYGIRSASGWSIRSFAASAAWADLAPDDEGTLHASWGVVRAALDRDLNYSRLGTDGEWLSYAVDVAGDVGLYTSIAVDAVGNVLIAYHDFGNEDLKLACRFRGVR